MKLNVCTYNIRCDVAADGINAFDGRKPLILREFPKYEADIIGFQEVLPHVRDWLEAHLPGYTILGTGRGADFGGEHVCLAYRTDKFLTVSTDTFWLSDSPRVPGSRFGTDQSRCPRICTAAVLLTREDHKLIRVYNTHLDHMGKMAQAQGMTLVLSRMAEDEAKYPGTPSVLCGDFNIQPDSPVVAGISAFRGLHAPLIDVTANVSATFHNYTPDKCQAKIDYIFTNAACDSSLSRTLTDHEEGVFFSDHYPVLATLEV